MTHIFILCDIANTIFFSQCVIDPKIDIRLALMESVPMVLFLRHFILEIRSFLAIVSARILCASNFLVGTFRAFAFDNLSPIAPSFLQVVAIISPLALVHHLLLLYDHLSLHKIVIKSLLVDNSGVKVYR